MKRRLRANLRKESTLDPEDNEKYLVYPVEENAQDAIEIYKGDLKRLMPPQYLNDSLIDLKIKLIIKDLPEEKRTRVRISYMLFISKFLSASLLLTNRFKVFFLTAPQSI